VRVTELIIEDVSIPWLILLDEGAMVLTALLTRLGVSGLDSTDLDDGTAVERLSLFTSSDMKTSLSHSGTFERFGLSRDFRLLYSVTCPRGPGLPWDGTALYRLTMGASRFSSQGS
jgi:hypothetical protein